MDRGVRVPPPSQEVSATQDNRLPEGSGKEIGNSFTHIALRMRVAVAGRVLMEMPEVGRL